VIERPWWAEGDGRLWSREWQAAETLTGGEEGERDEKGREEEDAGQGRGHVGMGGERQMPSGVPGVGPFSVVEVGGQRLVELEVGDGVWIGGVEPRCLVEQAIPLRRPASGREGRRPVGKVEVQKNGGEDGWVGEKGEDAHGAVVSLILCKSG
jgi:hypothetical protein